ncbi:PA0069 family radical SAM protein [Acidiphilium cryptum]|uniref:Radical SAM domain protein n=1 Tax=Acidiphilium cryptum (strain JF-5) TaxID=349163 RepID=A5FVY9_ACICJ|nr:PA0069 family radical SAM protein [Acidiphilium cryptum]ABQ29771.1 Radical SAM domain protein [Acidiphilium cryptum JF-5]
METVIPRKLRPDGRGTRLDPPNRFETVRQDAFDDGWGTLDEAPPPPATVLIRDATKSVISRNDSPDLGFDRGLNPYRGCEHGCIYCYARPTHAWIGMSPGLDFETKLVFKPEAATLLERELSRKGYQAAPIVLGSNTDPYQPVERQLRLTRAVLEVLERFGHPVSIVTKSAGVLRDVDILGRMAARNLARVHLSVTTLDARLARAMEPRAAAPGRRLDAITGLKAAGIPVGVLAAPMIPGVNDAELERILEASAKAGASCASAILLRLPHELGALFEDWLKRTMPDRAAHVLSLIRQTRGGALNDAAFGSRFRGTGAYAALLRARFHRAARQFGLSDAPPPLDCGQFAKPPAKAASAQLSLF